MPDTTRHRPVPVVADEVDAGYLTGALRASGYLGSSGEVVEVSHEPFATGVGLAGTLYRLRLRYAGLGADLTLAPSTAVLKLPAVAEANRAVVRAFGFYVREARCFAELTGSLGVRAPACYVSAVDEESGLACLLLEELSGWAAGCQVTGATLEQARHAIDTVAGLHARAWECEDLPAWLERLDAGAFAGLGPGYRAVWPAFLDRYAHVLPPGATALGLRLQERFEDLQHDVAAQAPLTVCHGDYRLDNLLFTDAETAMLDWQLVQRGPGAQDVAYFLSQSMSIELRRAHERALVRRWHEGLGAVATHYPIESAFAEYRRMALYMTVYAVMVGGAFAAENERGRALHEAMAVRSFTAALDLDAGEFLAA